MSNNLFVVNQATGIVYCDTSKEEHGDYMVIARLPYNTLKLEAKKPRSKLLEEIKADAAKYQKGDEINISVCQTLILGSAI